MSSSESQRVLALIKENIAKCSSNSNSKEADLKLWEFTQKGLFYSYNVTSELLEVLQSDQKLSKDLKKKFLNFIELSIFNQKDEKDSHISKIHNFLLRTKNSDDFTKIFNRSDEIKIKNPEILLTFTTVLIKFASTDESTKSSIQILKRFFNLYIKTHQQKVLNTTYKSVHFLSSKWHLVELLIKEVYINNTYKIDEEHYSEVVEILFFLAKFAINQKAVMNVCSQLSQKLSLEGSSIQKITFQAYDDLFNLSTTSKVDKKLIEKTLSLIKKLKKTDPCHQKIAKLYSKIFTNQLSSKNSIFDINEDVFNAFNDISLALYHILANIKSEEGVYECCTNIKRHEVAAHIENFNNYSTIFLKEFLHKLPPNFFSKVAYHIKYYFTIFNEIKCSLKIKSLKHLHNRVYNLLYEFNKLKAPIQYERFVKQLFDVRFAIPENDRKLLCDIFPLVLDIYTDKANDKESAIVCANGLFGLLNFIKHHEDEKYGMKYQMKLILDIEKFSKILQITSVTKYRESSNYKNVQYCPNPEMGLDEIISLEISALMRYYPSVEGQHQKNADLFEKLYNTTKDDEIYTKTFYQLTCQIVSHISLDKFKAYMKRLEDCQKTGLKSSLAFGVGNYLMYTIIDKDAPKCRKSSTEKAPKPTIERMSLKIELEIIKHLTEAQKYFSDFFYQIKSNGEDVEKINEYISFTRLSHIINTIGVQFFIRGMKMKEIESFTILWNLPKHEDAMTVLNISTIFIDNYQNLLDNSGKYLEFSSKWKPLEIEEVIDRANKIVKSNLKDFETISDGLQCHIMSYLISLWLFYFKKNRKSDAHEQFGLLKDLFNNRSGKLTSSDSRELVRAKLHFTIVDANLTNFSRGADNFMFKANGILLKVSSIDRDFSHQFYQIFYKITHSNINHALNRQSDLDLYQATILSMLNTAMKKNLCLKTLEILSLSILHKLNMEKIEEAKAQLRDITKVLGIQEEILIESPKRIEAPMGLLDYETPSSEAIRKSVFISPSSPNMNEYSIINMDHSENLLHQLKSFIHENSCKCDICKYPILKFYSFQIGCFYTRLLFLINKFDIGLKFHESAIEPWRHVCDKLRRFKSQDTMFMFDKNDFYMFSIRWLFQYADTLIRTQRFDEVREIYSEVDLLLVNNILDIMCIKQTLFCRKENLDFLLHNYNSFKEIKEESPKTFNFKDFLKATNRKEEDESTSSSSESAKSEKIPILKGSKVTISESSVKIKRLPTTKKSPTFYPPIPTVFIDDDEDKAKKSTTKLIKKASAELKTPISTSSRKPSSSKSSNKIEKDLDAIIGVTPKTRREPSKRNLRQ